MQHSHLFFQLLRRDLSARYRGSVLGVVWMLLTPLLLLAVYSFVFGVVFKAKWGLEAQEGTIPFPLLLFSGLIVHSLLSEILHRSVGQIRQHGNYVKKVIFPLPMLPMITIASALSLFAVQLFLLLIAMLAMDVSVSVSILYVPLILLPFMVLMTGLAWISATLGVFLPDLQHIVGLLVTMLLFLSPIFYPVEMLPEQWQAYLYLNPITPIIEMLRDALFYDTGPNWQWLGIYTVIAAIVAVCGYRLFVVAQGAFRETL